MQQSHPRYADTGDPVLSDEQFFTVADHADFLPTLEFHIYRLGGSLPRNTEYTSYVFYRHRHNAIAAWEKLLEESNGN